ncbi:MAG: hypothetical protein K6F94_02595 [Bacteroidaceae bacterium]|nr:hypothetical protein [Bacteroidaceae bacterium]
MMNNPKKDWSINPDHTWAINPIHTWAINPIHTWAINPIHTWSINPVHTWALNPHHTWALNPAHTWSLNPRHTPSLRPNSSSFEGYLVIDKNSDHAIYYTVDCKAEVDVLLVFDGADNPAFVAVGRAGGYSLFDYKTMEYVGYMASNGKDGYNWFSVDGEWHYYVLKK